MVRRLLSVLAVLAPGVAVAQGSNPYARYAAAIVTKADSAIAFLTSQVDSVSNESAVAALGSVAAQMQRLTSDFAKVEPPADLASVHRDLVSTLNLAAGRADHAATLMRTAMDSSGSVEQRTTAAETAQKELQELQTATTSYQGVRSRAGQILAQHGARLPPLHQN